MVVACPSDVKGVAGAPVGERVKGLVVKNVATTSTAECAPDCVDLYTSAQCSAFHEK